MPEISTFKASVGWLIDVNALGWLVSKQLAIYFEKVILQSGWGRANNKKLDRCGVLGVSSDEYLAYAEANRNYGSGKGSGAGVCYEQRFGPFGKDSRTKQLFSLKSYVGSFQTWIVPSSQEPYKEM
eukprot:scaffold3974_cov140-Cylindrotheca_fusiformis.AAC.5